ncbi:MAG TPA: ABC transporter permease [Vicinamibacterales bacterium]|jgi:putative ABC transport system permease protein|nr:ABC transporter permease [Vicinamibacterales bacterium]
MKRSLRSWLWRVPIEQEVDEELALHVEMRRREGRPLDDADIEQVRRACLAIARKRDRDMRLVEWFGDVREDVKFAVRQMRASVGFTLVATLTLALGIGANSAIFALADATLLRPLPFREPDRLVSIVERTAASPHAPVSIPTFEDLQHQSRSFDGLAAIQMGAGGGPLVTGPDGAVEAVERQSVSTTFFDLLGVAPVAGRTFRASDEGPRPTVVVFSESLWRGRFHADTSLIGRTVKLNGAPYTLVGVVPDRAQYTRPARMWTLTGDVPPFVRQRSIRVIEVVGRLKPGVTHEGARADVATIGARIAAEHADVGKGFALDLEPVRDSLMGPELQRTSLLLLAVVGFVLLMCCANVANLLLARTSARAQELAVRTALGAGRGRVVAQMLTESLVLALTGGVLGVALGAAILRVAPAVIPPGLLSPAVALQFDARVAAFGIAAALLVGIVFGLAPAWHATSGSLLRALSSESRTTTGGRRVRSVLVSGEVAAAVLLLCGAGLFLRTLLVLVSVDPGYRVDASRVLTLDFSLDYGPNQRYATPESLMQFYDSVARELGARPEVESVGWSSSLPYGTTEFGPFVIDVVGDPPLPVDGRPAADVAVTDDGYFRTLDLPIVAGRRFTERDSAAAPAVCIVNEAFVRRVLRGRNPLGVRIALQRNPQMKPIVKEIVGVARQTHGWTTDRDEFLQVYMPPAQYATGDVYMVARTSRGSAQALTPLIRSVVARHDPNTPVRRDRTLEYLSVESTAGYRFRAAIVGTFAALALTLAMIGVFGVLAYSVQQRQREFGVRLALGASSPSILWLVLGSAGRLIAIGGAIGLGLALLLGRSIAAFLFGVPAVDPVTFSSVTMLVVVTAAAASAAPAWRAARVDLVTMFRAN